MPETIARVFISSTVEDLRAYREAAKEAVIQAGMLPTMQEYFPASGANPPLQECMAKVAETDLLVVLVAHRYGWVPAEQPSKGRKSITWLECDQAVMHGHEVLAFFVDEKMTWPEHQRETAELTQAFSVGKESPELYEAVRQNAENLRCFKVWLEAQGVRSTFTTTEELRRKVGEALTVWRIRHPNLVSGKVPEDISSSDHVEKIVPRGLRSFERPDHKWFLRLVPGSRDDRGLPLGIRFWKERLEEGGGDRPPLKVGLLYGPSGCGKSSLIKAGLLPVLAEFVVPVYLEASSDHTEADVATRVRAKVPALPGGLSSSETMARLRAQPELLAGRRVVLFLDQFEQWLNARRGGVEGELANALRSCDGACLQAVLMVRDDFVLAVHRFLESLEVPIREDINMQKSDLFDLGHARRVLVEYGRAYDRLPADMGALTRDHADFLDRALNGLKTWDDKLVPVQLAMFSQMLKGREWTRETLKDLGGAQGVGVSFLRGSFDHRSANPTHRKHREAAMAVLKKLLPPSGSDIRGHSQPAGELRRAAGYGDRPSEFAELLEVLDKDLLIVTPTEGATTEGATDLSAVCEARYQLTHDYLVPSLRTWLTEQQKQTVRGRATMCLEERTQEWKQTRHRRFLPSLIEHLRISCWVPKSKLDELQRSMLRAADRFYLLCAIPFLILAAILWLLWEGSRNERAGRLMQAVLMLPAEALPYAIEQLRPFQGRAKDRLREIVETGRLGSDEVTPQQRLHAALALADFGDVHDAVLLDHLAAASPGQCSTIVRLLKPNRKSVLEQIEKRLGQTIPAHQQARFVTIALHLGQVEPALRVLALSNTTARAAFIHDYPNWHDDLTQVAEVLRAAAEKPAFGDLRSGICAALALTASEPLSELERTNVVSALAELYATSPDGGTHNAALAGLVKWGAPAPVQNPSLQPANRPRTGQDWYVNTLGMTMIRIPAGEFQMGADESGPPEEQPRHRVVLTKAFFFSDREVTVEWFTNFVNDPDYPAEGKPGNWSVGSLKTPLTPDCPVPKVSWNDAIKFCNWLSWRENRRCCYTNSVDGEVDFWKWDREADGYRLPTEAEWEYSCRAQSTGNYTFGDDVQLFGEYAHYVVNSTYRLRPTAHKLPNGWGLFDMHGNVWEWCWDGYGENYYKLSPINNPTGTSGGTNTARIVRGGSILDMPQKARCSARLWHDPDRQYPDFGFRIVAPAASTDAR